MKRTPKFLLLEEDFEALDAIGICSSLSDYRMAWNLNKTFGWQLGHSSLNIRIPQKKSSEPIEYLYYEHLGWEDLTDMYLIKNKQTSKPMLEDYPQLDYLLVIKNNVSMDIDELIADLRKHQQIIAAYKYLTTDFTIAEFLQFDQSHE